MVDGYIGFVDSDDWIDEDYFEKMLEAAQISKLPVALNTNMLCEHEDGGSKWFHQSIGPDVTGVFPVPGNLDKVTHTSCSYLYSRAFLERINVRFPEGLMCEDLYFQRVCLVHADTISVINKPAYHYCIRESSVMGQKETGLRFLDCVEVVDKLYDYSRTNNILDKMPLCIDICCHLFSLTESGKDLVFTAVKKLFLRMKDDINSRRHLYTEDELIKFDALLAAGSYSEYDALCRKHCREHCREHWRRYVRRELLDSLRRTVKNET